MLLVQHYFFLSVYVYNIIAIFFKYIMWNINVNMRDAELFL